MINLSITNGIVPESWKDALVKPKLKQLKATPVYKNYRPLSNLSYMSKLTEKVVAKQTVHHLDTHDLFPVNQSAYRESHSTETALLKVCNDILQNMDTQQVTLLILLDLSTAFDMIDHSILLDCLHNNFGFTDDSLAWFRSYLSGRSQHVVIDSTWSQKFNVEFGVPQGSCLGPILFTIYTSQLFDVIRHHLLDFHSYTDDSQLYIAF